MADPFDDYLDGCDLDFTVERDSNLAASLRPLYPEGDPSLRDWSGVFDAP